MSMQPETAIRYLHYLIKARSKFDLHSPFVYNIYSQILKDKTSYGEFGSIEKLRSQLLKDKRSFSMRDLGSGTTSPTGYFHSVSVKKVAKNASVSPTYGQLLFRIARHFRPAVMLELGTSLGLSTSYLAMGNPLGKITTIEGCRETAAVARENFGLLGLTNILQKADSFKVVLPDLLQKLGKVDLCFIDGNHRKAPTLHYFYQCLQHIDDDSVIILDDIHRSAEMVKAWNEIKANPSVTITIDLFQMGLVFFKKGLSNEDFIIHF